MDRPITRAGFTLIEMLITLVIAGILVAIVIPRIGVWRSEYAATNARNALIMLGARAQASALETGGVVCLRIDPTANTAIVEAEETGDVIDNLNYASGQFRADLSTSAGDLDVCYTVRGFARPPPTTGTFPARVTFSVNQARAMAVVRALGDIEPL